MAALSEQLLCWLEEMQPNQQASLAEMECHFNPPVTSSELAAALTMLQKDDSIYLKSGVYHVM